MMPSAKMYRLTHLYKKICLIIDNKIKIKNILVLHTTVRNAGYLRLSISNQLDIFLLFYSYLYIIYILVI